MSDFIKNIEIENFKSIQHQTIDGCKRINVFIGYPNVGKSNILEAMSTFSYLQRDYANSYSDLCRYKRSSQLFFDGNIQEPSVIKINNGWKPEDNFKIILTYISENEVEFKLFNPNQKIDFPDNLPPEQLILRTGKFDVTSKFTGSSINGNLTYDLSKIKKFQFKGIFNDSRLNGKTLFSPNGENLFEVVQLNSELRKEVVELFKAYDLKLSFDQSASSLMALKTLDDETIFLIPFYLIADTLQRLIFHKAAIMSNENTVLLFEEPEAHMFPPYIKKFTGDIIFNKGNNNQYFISTHSPVVIGDFLEDAREELSVYLVGYKNGETNIKRLSEEQLNEIYEYGVDLFFNIESYLD